MKSILFIVALLLFNAEKSFSAEGDAFINERVDLSTYGHFFEWFETKNFDSSKTLIAFDIDNTLVKEDPPFLNHDLFGEQKDQAEIISKNLGLSPTDARLIQKEMRKQSRGYKKNVLIEEPLVDVINGLQEQGFLTTTMTASGLGVKDKRVSMLKEKRIDFSVPFMKEIYRGETLPFHKGKTAEGKDDWDPKYYYGQASSRGIKKSEKIREIVSAINGIHLRKGVPEIDTVIFVDNKKSQAKEVAKNLGMNVHSIYYTFVRNNTDIDRVAEEFKIAMSALDNMPDIMTRKAHARAKSVNQPCQTQDGPVQSANIMLVSKSDDGKAHLYLGHNAKNRYVLELPGGHCETQDESAYHTAAREGHEETGGYLKITPEELMKHPYIYADPDHGNRVLFIVRDDEINLNELNGTIQEAFKNKNLSKHFREISGYSKIPVKSFLKRIKSTKSPKKVLVGPKKDHQLKPNTSKTLVYQFDALKEKLSEILEMELA